MLKGYLVILLFSITIFGQNTPNVELDKFLPKMIEVLQTDTSFMVTIDYYRPLPYEIKNNPSKSEALRRKAEIRREAYLRYVDTSKKTLLSERPSNVMTFLFLYNGFVTHNSIITDTMALFSMLPYLHSADSQFCQTHLLEQTSYPTLVQHAQRIKPYFETTDIYKDLDMLALYCLLLSPNEKKEMLVDTTFLNHLKKSQSSTKNMAVILASLGSDSAEEVLIASYKNETDYFKKVKKISGLVYVGSDKTIRALLESFNDTIYGDCSMTLKGPIIEALNRRFHDIPIIGQYNHVFHPANLYSLDPQWVEEYLSRFDAWMYDTYNIVPQGGAPQSFQNPCVILN